MLLALVVLGLGVSLESKVEMLVSVCLKEVACEVSVTEDIPGMGVLDIKTHCLGSKINTLFPNSWLVFWLESFLHPENHGKVSQRHLVRGILLHGLSVAENGVLKVSLLPVHIPKSIQGLMP